MTAVAIHSLCGHDRLKCFLTALIWDQLLKRFPRETYCFILKNGSVVQRPLTRRTVRAYIRTRYLLALLLPILSLFLIMLFHLLSLLRPPSLACARAVRACYHARNTHTHCAPSAHAHTRARERAEERRRTC